MIEVDHSKEVIKLQRVMGQKFEKENKNILSTFIVRNKCTASYKRLHVLRSPSIKVMRLGQIQEFLRGGVVTYNFPHL